MKSKLKFEVTMKPPPERCGKTRGQRSKTRCELPPGHYHNHIGRSPSGRWFIWADA